MKNFSKFMLFSLLAAFIFSSCKKEINKITFEDGTAPTATSSLSGSVVLTKAQKDVALMSLNWTNASYTLSTGVNSQDVTYAIQIDTTGGSKFITASSVKASLNKAYTQGELNDFLIKEVSSGGLGLTPLKAYDLRIRIKSFLGLETDDNTTNRYSNILTLKVTPYSVDPELWITGDATGSGWTNSPPDTQKFTWDNSAKQFTLLITLPNNQALEGYKFLTLSGSWQPQWGGAPATGGNISENPGGGSDPAAIKPPAVAGNYKLTVSLINKTLTVEKL